MPIARLIPNVERRLSAWVGVQERLRREPRDAPRPAITISRQFGCEAYPLAELLTKELEACSGESWTIFDEALISRASRDLDLSETLLGNIGGESRLLDNLANLIPGWHTQNEAYEQLARYILRIARDGNSIIVGRGGAVITQSLENCCHVRLEAPFELRVESIQKRLSLDEDEAKALVIDYERNRERFIERFLGCSMADTRYYHAIYNTGKSSLAQIGNSILELLPTLAPR
jgi:cytidylate kinase